MSVTASTEWPTRPAACKAWLSCMELVKPAEGRVQRFNTVDGTELRQLPKKFAVVHWLERVLVLELRDHQGQEVSLTEAVARFACGCGCD